MSSIQSINVYQISRPSRFNPEFIGIAQQFAEIKKNKIKIQKQHKKLSVNLNYNLKLNDSLQKSLDSKQKKLEKLKKIRQRHNQDIYEKLKSQNQRKKKLQNLKQKTQFERKSLKINIQNEINKLIQDRKRNKKQIQNQSKIREELLCNYQTNRLLKNHEKYLTIKSEQLKGNLLVDSFYRQKNLQSLNQYKTNISSEQKKIKSYKNDIIKMQQNLNIVIKKNKNKLKKLDKIKDQIYKYSTLNEFYSSRLNRTGFGQVQNKSKSTRSRKPSQILISLFTKNQQQYTNQEDLKLNPQL